MFSHIIVVKLSRLVNKLLDRVSTSKASSQLGLSWMCGTLAASDEFDRTGGTTLSIQMFL